MWKERAKILKEYESWLPRIAEAAKEVLGEVEVYLFGSVAEGRALPSSDVDILIVTKLEDVEKARRKAEFVAEIEEKAGWPLVHLFEIHLMCQDELEVWVDVFKPKLVGIS